MSREAAGWRRETRRELLLEPGADGEVDALVDRHAATEPLEDLCVAAGGRVVGAWWGRWGVGVSSWRLHGAHGLARGVVVRDRVAARHHRAAQQAAVRRALHPPPLPAGLLARRVELPPDKLQQVVRRARHELDAPLRRPAPPPLRRRGRRHAVHQLRAVRQVRQSDQVACERDHGRVVDAPSAAETPKPQVRQPDQVACERSRTCRGRALGGGRAAAAPPSSSTNSSNISVTPTRSKRRHIPSAPAQYSKSSDPNTNRSSCW